MRRAVTISVPEEMYSFIREQTRRGMHGSVSDYVRSLIRRDQPDLAPPAEPVVKDRLRTANECMRDAALAEGWDI